MGKSNGEGCLFLILITIVIAAVLFSFSDTDIDDDQYNEQYENRNIITDEDVQNCLEHGGTEAMCEG